MIHHAYTYSSDDKELNNKIKHVKQKAIENGYHETSFQILYNTDNIIKN